MVHISDSLIREGSKMTTAPLVERLAPVAALSSILFLIAVIVLI
ncbi:hypothetical protein [Ciceribacter ferrooxidans]|nr:hypothetical protein [Ciceribacter ferrooxidans]